MNRRPLTCIIIEDEPIAADIIKEYISEVNSLEFKACFIDALTANEYLKKEAIDVIFLDIHLPGLKGNEFLKTLSSNYQVVFTTAYSDYAMEGYDLNVVDYLLKPISLTRFIQAVNKLSSPSISKESFSFEVFHENKKQYKINHDEILYVESNRDYCKIHLTDSTTIINTKMTITELYNRLSEKGFRRIHKSFVVNESKIKMTSAHEIMVNTVVLPIGRKYRL